MIDVILVRGNRDYVEDLHQYAVKLDRIPAVPDKFGMKEDGGCVGKEWNATRIANLMPPVEERVIEERVDRQVREEPRYCPAGCGIEVAPDREMQLRPVIGAGHRPRCHPERREGRDVDPGASAPDEDIDAVWSRIGPLIVLVDDRVVRLAEPFQVFAIDLSDERRSWHVPDHGSERCPTAGGAPARSSSPSTIQSHIYAVLWPNRIGEVRVR